MFVAFWPLAIVGTVKTVTRLFPLSATNNRFFALSYATLIGALIPLIVVFAALDANVDWPNTFTAFIPLVIAATL